ncbi:hypothetical protein C8F01DRAFT_1077870 [Mycena amicta]|nr:hypothetical protein C8F01DRAFT_1077870 [Mycena amicta]
MPKATSRASKLFSNQRNYVLSGKTSLLKFLEPDREGKNMIKGQKKREKPVVPTILTPYPNAPLQAQKGQHNTACYKGLRRALPRPAQFGDAVRARVRVGGLELGRWSLRWAGSGLLASSAWPVGCEKRVAAEEKLDLDQQNFVACHHSPQQITHSPSCFVPRLRRSFIQATLLLKTQPDLLSLTRVTTLGMPPVTVSTGLRQRHTGSRCRAVGNLDARTYGTPFACKQPSTALIPATAVALSCLTPKCNLKNISEALHLQISVGSLYVDQNPSSRPQQSEPEPQAAAAFTSSSTSLDSSFSRFTSSELSSNACFLRHPYSSSSLVVWTISQAFMNVSTAPQNSNGPLSWELPDVVRAGTTVKILQVAVASFF